MFPDVAPSSLFGQQWFLDLLTRESCGDIIVGAGTSYKMRKPNSDNAENTASDLRMEEPLSVNGIFGETEQWLWAANRALRKLNLLLAKQRKDVEGQYRRLPEDSTAKDHDRAS